MVDAIVNHNIGAAKDADTQRRPEPQCCRVRRLREVSLHEHWHDDRRVKCPENVVRFQKGRAWFVVCSVNEPQSVAVPPVLVGVPGVVLHRNGEQNRADQRYACLGW